MQLLGNKSEEGSLPGFGWIDSEIKRFPKDKKLKVPHMGWNIVKKEREHFLFEDMPHEELRFYFVHTFQMQNTYADDVLSTTEYGLKFTSSTSHENVHGVQFHPEKSHKFGLQLMKNFANA
jgi:glutamine amidotransferase